jgi:tRNA dimethylallyltransferase
LGVAALADHLAGRQSLAAAAAAVEQQTRQYAKRQMTWFRRNMISWTRIETKEMERTTAEILAFIEP